MKLAEGTGARTCSRCGIWRTRRQQGYCNPCHAAYMRDHRSMPHRSAEIARAKERYWRERAEALEARCSTGNTP